MAVGDSAEILRQLSEIARLQGEQGKSLEQLREDFEGVEREQHDDRDKFFDRLDNLTTRMGAVENATAALKMVIEKTVMPMIESDTNRRQRMIGAMAAYGTIFGLIGGATAVFWKPISDFIGKIGGP